MSASLTITPNDTLQFNNGNHSDVNGSGTVDTSGSYISTGSHTFEGDNIYLHPAIIEAGANFEFFLRDFMALLISADFGTTNSKEVFNLSAGAGAIFEKEKFSMQIALRGGIDYSHYYADIIYGNDNKYISETQSNF